MDASWQYLITLVVIGLCQQKCYSYDFRCPVQPEWNIRGNAKCGIVLEYFCVLDDNVKKYTEFCKGNPDITRDITWKKGQKSVLRGNLDGEVCSKERYQPFIFRTDGNSDCVYKQSLCQGEGMIIHKNGSKTVDTQCRCDHSKGFAFVSRVKHTCYCIPTQEDCSCSEKHCKKNFKLSSDYTCTSIYSQDNRSPCSGFDTGEWTNDVSVKPKSKKEKTDTFLENDMNKVSIKMIGKRRAILTVAIFTGFCVIIAFIIFFMDGTDKKQAKDLLTVADKTGKKALLGKEIFRENIEELPKNIQDIFQVNGESERIPKNIQEKYNQHIEGWEKDNQTFIVTGAAKTIYEKLRTDNCVLVIGPNGSGKSSIIRNIALRLHNEEHYEIIPIVLCPSNILAYHRRHQKQVFVIDDFCGKFLINAQNVDVWSTHIETLLKLIKNDLNHCNTSPGSLKVLFALNEDISKEKMFTCRLEPLIEFCFKLSDNPLTMKEKSILIKKYIPTKLKSTLKSKLESDEVHYPLLYKLSKGKTVDQIVKLFDNLDEFIKQDLLTLKENNDIKFCIISFCALFENHFNENMLNDNFKFATQKEENAFNEMCAEFSFDLHKESSRMRLKGQLQSFEDSYLSKTEDYYSLTESIVYQVAEIVCAQIFVNCFIKFAPTSFIATRYRFRSTNEEKNDDVVWIKERYHEKKYFHRLILDLEEGLTYSTFHNEQLCNILYRNKFLAYCSNRKEKIKELLYKIKESNQFISKSEQCSVGDNCDYADYLDFKNPYYFISHKMRMPLIESAWEGYADIVKMLLEMGRDIDETDKFKRTALIVGSYLNKTKVVTELLNSGANHSLCDEKGQSALLVASREGYYDIVKALLQYKANTELCDFKGQTPLMVASICGHKDVVEVLLTSLADIYKCDNAGRSSLFLACLNGRKDVVSVLIRNKANVNKCDLKELSPLSVACKTENENVIRALIKAGANISNVDNEGRFPLFIACEEGLCNVADILISRGANETQCDWENRSPLFIACEKGHLEIVTLLIKSNSGLIEICDEDGRSSLFVACEKGKLKIAEILLDKGADSNKVDKKGRSPFYAACRSGFPAIVNLLHSKCATTDKCSIWGCSPLFVASREGHFTVVELLIKFGADVSKANANGKTPLIVACEEGNVNIASVLIESGANVNHSDKEKNTALHNACFVGHLEIVQLLIRKGTDKTLRNMNKKTPLEIARTNEYHDIVKLLTSKC